MKIAKYILLSLSVGIVLFSDFIIPTPEWREVFYRITVIAVLYFSFVTVISVVDLWKRRKKQLAIFLGVLYLLSLPIICIHLLFYPNAGFMCGEEKPIHVSWENCQVQFIILNKSCIPDGPAGGVVYVQTSSLPFMHEVLRQKDMWFSKSHFFRDGNIVKVSGKTMDSEHELPSSCHLPQ